MTPEDWEIIQAAFRRALELSGPERDAFLASFEAEHPELGRQLRDLVAADGESDERLAAPIAASVEQLADESADPWVGKTIGAWKITRRIAAGGMAAVFLADRTDGQFEQQVAIKIMSAQLLSPDAVARFKAERQILADLNHPFIAQLHDGGTTDAGLPYLVMEYVDGLPIDRHCEDRELSIDARLELFRKICDAVDYAHRNLTVHRDLKPSNILVAANGDPKLLDFGIAKLLEAGQADKATALTREGTRAMTPEYASPEQVRSEPISVATDVYSLGVLLYRLLTGVSPYGSSISSSADYERAIVDQDPPKPSTVVTDSTQDHVGVHHQGLSAQQLRKRLSGDLDNIVLKTLQKDPERRYATPTQLAEDIDRYLNHKPVQARADSWAYRSRKFLRRHATSVVFAAVTLLTIGSLVTFYTLRLAEERDRANHAALLSGEVSEFLVQLFDSASPHTSRGNEVTAIELLDEGRNRIETLAEQPRLQAELKQIMGRSYTALGEATRGIELLRNALQARQQHTGAEPLELADAHHDLAEAYRQDGRLAEAETHLQEALAIREGQLGVNNADYAYTLGRLGVVLFDQRRRQEALALEQQALEVMQGLGRIEDPVTIDLMGNIANALDSLGRYDEAEAMHRLTIAASERVDGELHPNTVIRISNLALVQIRTHQLADALDTITTAFEGGRKIWPDDHPQIAFMLATQGSILKRMGRMNDALSSYQEATDMARRIGGENSADYARRLRGLGSLQRDLRQFAAAEKSYNAAQRILSELYGADSAQPLLISIYMGQLHNDQRQFAEAEAYLRRGLSRPDRLSKLTAIIGQRELARSISGQGRLDDADPILQATLADREALTTADDASLISFLAPASEHYRRSGDLQRALGYAERAAAIADTVESPSWLDVSGYAEYARVLVALGRQDDAERYFRRAHSVLSATFGDDDHRVKEIESNLAD